MGNKQEAGIILTAVDQTKEAFRSVNEGLNSVTEAAGGFNEVLARLAPLLGAASFTELLKGSLETADQMGKMAQKAGVSIESLSRLSVAARLSDVDTQSLASAMGHLSQSLATAAAGTGTQYQAFKALGISVKDAHGNLKDADTVMAEVSDRFSKLADGSGKTAAAMAIFGKSGQEIIPMLNNGSEELDRFAKLSDQLGLTLDGKTSQAAQDVNDRFTMMGMAAQGIGLQLMKNMMPAMTQMSQSMLDAATDSGTMKDAAESLTIILKGLISTGMGVAYVFKSAGDNIGGFAAAAMAAVHGDFSQASRILDDMQKGNQQRTAAFSSAIDKLWQDAPVPSSSASASAHGVHKNSKPKLSFALGGPQLTAKQDAAAQSNVLQMMKGNFDQQVAARELSMQVMSVSARALAQEYAKIDATESKAMENADKLFAGGKMSAKMYHDTLAKVTAEADRQRSVAKQLQDQQDALNLSWEYGAKTALQTYLDAATNTAQQTQKLFGDMFKGMEDALVNFVKTGKLDFKSLADSIITDMIRMQIQQNVTAPLAKAMQGMFGGSSGSSGSSSGSGVIQNIASNIFGGARASGGPVSYGQSYLVGEQGPEIFTPSQSGSIIPNSRLAGSQPLVVQISVPIDARGADPSIVPQFNQALMALEKRIYQNVPLVMRQNQIRNMAPVTAGM